MNDHITLYGSASQIKAYHDHQKLIGITDNQLSSIDKSIQDLWVLIVSLPAYGALVWVSLKTGHPYAFFLALVAKYTCCLIFSSKILSYVRFQSKRIYFKSLLNAFQEMISNGDENLAGKSRWFYHHSSIHLAIGVAVLLVLTVVISLYIDKLVLPVVRLLI